MQSPIAKALEILRGMAHSNFTSAKCNEVIALLELEIAVVGDGALLSPAVAADEIDEDPAEEEAKKPEPAKQQHSHVTKGRG